MTTPARNVPAVRIPRGLKRRCQHMLLAAVLVAEDSGEVVGGCTRLGEVLEVSDLTQVRETVALLVGDGYMRRVGLRLFVVWHHLSAGCENCRAQIGASGKWCPRCKQVVGRKDRAWQPQAVAMAVAGKSPPEIAVGVGRPLWRSELLDESGRSQGGAVVPHLINEGLGPIIGEEWREALDELGLMNLID